MESSSSIRFSQKRKKNSGINKIEVFLFHINVSNKVYCSNFRIRVTGSLYFDALPSLRLGFYFVVQKWLLKLHPSHPYSSQLGGDKRILFKDTLQNLYSTRPPLSHRSELSYVATSS